MEEGGGNELDEVKTRLVSWHELGGTELVESVSDELCKWVILIDWKRKEKPMNKKNQKDVQKHMPSAEEVAQ